jgi:hypothetical protein
MPVWDFHFQTLNWKRQFLQSHCQALCNLRCQTSASLEVSLLLWDYSILQPLLKEIKWICMVTLFRHMLFSTVVLKYAFTNHLFKRLFRPINLFLSLFSEIFLHTAYANTLRYLSRLWGRICYATLLVYNRVRNGSTIQSSDERFKIYFRCRRGNYGFHRMMPLCKFTINHGDSCIVELL